MLYENSLTCHKKSLKTTKYRITVFVCSNMDGSDKRQLVVIGKSAKPRSFKNVKHMPVNYLSNTSSWMTAAFFSEWLKKFNNKILQQNRNIILFVDNCTAHPMIKLSNIKLVFLPTNTSSVLQPMDAGIIKALKGYYRTKIIRRILAASSLRQSFTKSDITLLDAVYTISAAWLEVSAKTIFNCFKKCGFNKDSVVNNIEIVEEIYDEDTDAFINADLHVATCIPLPEILLADTVDNVDSEATKLTEPTDESSKIDHINLKSVYQALATIKLYVRQHDDADFIESLNKKIEDIEALINASVVNKQSKITDFFNQLSLLD